MIRRDRKGNVLVLASALVLGLTLIMLGVSQFMLGRMRDVTYLRASGFAPYQARLAAEAGVNALLRKANANTWVVPGTFTQNNINTTSGVAPNMGPTFGTGSTYGTLYSAVPLPFPFGTTNSNATYSVWILSTGLPGGGVRLTSTGSVYLAGTVPSGYTRIDKSITFDLASGSAWTLASTSYSP